MHTFFVAEIGEEGTLQRLEKRESDHLFKILRARAGELVELLDGCGTFASAEILPDRSVVIRKRLTAAEPAGKLRLYCAPPRRAKFDVLLKQAAELGVSEIQLVTFERNVAKPEGSDRWEILLQEGCKQSKNPFLPKVRPLISFAEFLALCYSREEAVYFGAIRFAGKPEKKRTSFAWTVGPEGGFTGKEEAQMLEAGIRPLNLGPYVLRLETAAVCGLAVLRQWMEEAR